MSTLIEVAQYFIVRNTAVDDIILNTAGALCGYFLFLLIRKCWPKFANGFRCTEHLTWERPPEYPETFPFDFTGVSRLLRFLCEVEIT